MTKKELFRKELTKFVKAYAKAFNAKEKKEADRQEKITVVKERYESIINQLAEEEKVTEADVKRYILEHRAELFDEGCKTMVTDYGTVQIKFSNPKLVIDDGRKIDEFVVEIEQRMPTAIKVKKTVSTEYLVANRENPIVAEILNEIGGRIVREERVRIDLKRRG